MKRSLAILGIALFAAAVVVQPTPPSTAHAAGAPPNIVLILTDDQVANTLAMMPNVQADLVGPGTTLSAVYDNNPLCCPSRATILTGQTSGHDGVWYNSNSTIGGWQSFRPHIDQTIFRWLHDAGYRTGFDGKLMNGYNYKAGDYRTTIPGVDEWNAFLLDGTDVKHTGCDQQGYWSTCYSHNGTLEKHGPNEYSTTTSGDKAVDFITSTPTDQPLFLYYAPRAPHLPTTPEPGHANGCAGLPLHRPPSYGVPLVHGPAFMPTRGFSKTKSAWFDAHWLADCQTLLSVDDQVGRIVDTLSATGRLANTMIVYASDNGFMFGEHLWKGKIVPYEESDHVPVVIRWDALGHQPAVASDLVTNMDYTATFLDAAGTSAPAGYRIDGQSLLPIVGGSGSWTPEPGVLIEHAGGDKVPPYCGIRTADWMFAHYGTGEEELYDVHGDPFQMVNVAGSNPGVVAGLRAQTVGMCNPLPPGFAW